MDNVFEQVEKNIDNLVVNGADWTACASKEQLQAARDGKLRLSFFDRDVPTEWLKDIKGKRVLCLAGAGGLQAPLLAIINPPSLMYVPEVSVVFRECYRVLNKGGIFIMMVPSPINYVCDYIEDEHGGYYKAVHRMPFCSKDHDDSEWIEYGHTMEEYLGGLLECGFLISGYVECQMDDITELHFMTRAVKN